MKKILAFGLAAVLASSVVAQTSPGTIVDVAAGNSTFSTLVAAVTTADLVGTLSSAGRFGDCHAQCLHAICRWR